ncbi:MAG: diaminopimelate decarboxylase [bacterium]|nr:diaminopimelate decarboxylase [bacterium]
MNLINENNQLILDTVNLKSLAEKYQTPLFIYSYESLKMSFLDYKKELSNIKHLICYAMKSNSNHSLVKELGGLGSGADTVSGGEIFRALKAGIDPKKIVYAGVAKKEEEIDFALNSGILMFNVESVDELEKINERAILLKKKAGIAIRVNPDVDPKTHPYISTGLAKNKFGISIKRALEVYQYASSLSGIEVLGIHMHIGSQLLDVSPYEEAFNKVYDLYLKLEQLGIAIKYINIGGGLGIVYDSKLDKQPRTSDMLENITEKIKKHDLTLILEPGRSIIGNAGICITKVLYHKESGIKKFVIVDAAMNDVGRPSLYGAYHEILPLEEKGNEDIVADIVGGICESTDYFARDRKINQIAQGEYLVIKSVGAYCASMGSNYNSRLRPAEILIKNKEVILIRERETYEDLILREKI